jgi:hypothetical protein
MANSVGKNLGMDTPTRSLGRFKKGVSGNPTGRPKTYPELRAMCQQKTIEGVEAVEEILWDPAQPGSTRVAAWTALRDTGFDKPAQRIAFRDYTEHPADDRPKNGNELDHAADMYARMLGGTYIPPPMFDVTPSALPAPSDNHDSAVEELQRLWAEEDAEQQSTIPSNEGMVEQQPQSRAQPRERIRRPRRM